MSDANQLTLNHDASCYSEQLTANLVGKCRTEEVDGVKYLVAKIAALNPGVLNGSRGPLLYTPEDTRKATKSWNQIPLVVYHPTDDAGKPISANTDGVVHVGFTKNAKYGGKLTVEGWFDVEKTKATDSRVYDALINGTPMEVSTGLGTTNEEAPAGASYLGHLYSHIARDHRPDHLAILPDQRGACSINDGCGLHVNQQGEKMAELLCTNCGDDGECETCKAKRKKMQDRQHPADEPIENVENKITTNELSHDDLRQRLNTLLNEKYGTPQTAFGITGPVGPSNLWVTDVYDKDFVYQDGAEMYRLGYSTDLRSDIVTLSEDAPKKVTKVSTYKTVANRLLLKRVGTEFTTDKAGKSPATLVANSSDLTRGEPNMAGKLTDADRLKLVEGLTTNSGFEVADIWGEDDVEVLNAMSDEKLFKTALAKQTLIDQQTVVNQVSQITGERKVENMANAIQNAFKPFKKKVSKADDAEEDSADEGDDEDMEANSEPEFKTPRQMTEAEFMRMAPPSIRADLEFSRATQNREKQELIGQITANVSGEELDQAVNYLKTKPLTELRIIANVATKPAVIEHDFSTRRSPNYGGQGIPTINHGRKGKVGEGPKPVTINWAEDVQKHQVG